MSHSERCEACGGIPPAARIAVRDRAWLLIQLKAQERELRLRASAALMELDRRNAFALLSDALEAAADAIRRHRDKLTAGRPRAAPQFHAGTER